MSANKTNAPRDMMDAAVRSASVETLRKLLNDPDNAEMLRLIARHKRMQFEAHVDAGFTPDQALRLLGPS